MSLRSLVIVARVNWPSNKSRLSDLHSSPCAQLPLVRREPRFQLGLPKTQKRHDSILLVVDWFFKMAHFIPCSKTSDAPRVAIMLFDNIISFMGCLKLWCSIGTLRLLTTSGKHFGTRWTLYGARKLKILQSFLKSMKDYNNSNSKYKGEEIFKLKSPLCLMSGSSHGGGKWVLFFIDEVSVKLLWEYSLWIANENLKEIFKNLNTTSL